MEQHQRRKWRTNVFCYPAQGRRACYRAFNTLALSLLLTRPENGEDGTIFLLIKMPDNVAKYVRRIKDKAWIEKDITYHRSRHSAARLAITVGTELYSGCKILGHGSTPMQVYAKVNLEKKIETISLINPNRSLEVNYLWL